MCVEPMEKTVCVDGLMKHFKLVWSNYEKKKKKQWMPELVILQEIIFILVILLNFSEY